MLETDTAAPAIDSCEVAISAPIDLVFATLTDFASWPSWQPDVSACTADMPDGLRVGSEFRWKSRGARIRSTIDMLDAPRAIGWRGKALGTEAVHIWHLRIEGDQTVVMTEESMRGWLPSAMRGPTRRALRRGIASATSALKAEAERRQHAEVSA